MPSCCACFLGKMGLLQDTCVCLNAPWFLITSVPLYGLCLVILTYTAPHCLSRSFRLKPSCPDRYSWEPSPALTPDTRRHTLLQYVSVLAFLLLLVTLIHVLSLSSLLGWDVLWKGCLLCAQDLAHRRDWSACEKNRWSELGLFPGPSKVHGHQAYPLHSACFTKSPKKWSCDPAQSLPSWEGAS